MFFDFAKQATIYARIETIRTHKQHLVVPTIKYLCPPKTYFGRDYVNGFTVVLREGYKPKVFKGTKWN